jgi:hypothetical protein
VREKLPKRDPFAAGKKPREPAPNRVLERQLSLADQLEEDGRNERFRHAADAEAVARVERSSSIPVGKAADLALYPVTVSDERESPGCPGCDDVVERLSKLWLCFVPAASGDDDRRADE